MVVSPATGVDAATGAFVCGSIVVAQITSPTRAGPDSAVGLRSGTSVSTAVSVASGDSFLSEPHAANNPHATMSARKTGAQRRKSTQVFDPGTLAPCAL